MKDSCYFCMRSFKQEDFSTLFCYRADHIELIAHDDCLEFFTQGQESLIVQLGHKIWGVGTSDEAILRKIHKEYFPNLSNEDFITHITSNGVYSLEDIQDILPKQHTRS